MSVKAIVLVILLTACAAPASSLAPGASEGDAPSVDLPAECVAAITDFLREIEPTVSGIDFESASAEDLDALATELEPASDAFNPDLCPDVEVAEARAAWIEIAQRVAPGTVGYIDYIYAE